MDLQRLKWPLVGVGGALAAILLVSQLLASMVDGDALMKPLSEYVEKMTGRPLIYGDVSVRVLSGSGIRVDGIAIRNTDGAKEQYLLEAQTLEIDVGLLEALTSDAPQVEAITLIKPKIQLERFRGGNANWSFLSQQDTPLQGEHNLTLRLQDGEVFYSNHTMAERYAIKELSGSISAVLGQLSYDLSAKVKDKALVLNGLCQFGRFTNISTYSADCTGRASGEGLSTDWQSRIQMTAGALQSRYTLNVQSADVRGWIDALLMQHAPPLAEFYASELPLSFKAEGYAGDDRTVINLGDLALGNSKGKLSVSADHTKQGNAVIIASLDRLDYDEIAAAVGDSLGGEKDPLALRDGLSQDMAAKFQFQVAALPYRGITLNNVTLQGEAIGGELSVTGFRANLPGKGTLTSLGRAFATAKGLEYQGLVEASGESLQTLFPLVGLTSSEIPDGTFTTYRSRFNLIANPFTTTISELRLVTGDRIKIAGGLNIYAAAAGEPARLSGTIGLENIDLSPFEVEWRNGASLLTPPEQQTKKTFAFDWLQEFDRDVRLRLELKSFDLHGLEGTDSSLNIRVAKDTLAVDDVAVRLAGSRIRGKMALTREPKKDRPQLAGVVNISRLNLGNALHDFISAQTPSEQTIWSKTPLNFYPLHYFDGRVELRVGQLVHDKFSANSVRAIALLDDETLRLKQVQAVLWAGNFEADVTVDSSVVPGLDMTYQLTNAEIGQVLPAFATADNIAGQMSLSGNLAFSGVSFHNWIQSLAGNVAFDMRNIFVRSFNLPGIVRSVSAVRAVPSLANAVRLAFSNGSTRIGSINGVLTMSGGELSFAKADIRSNESVGAITGKVDLQRWALDISTRFGLIAFAQKNYPNLVVNFTGPLAQPKRDINLKSLEAFLAQKLR